MKKLIVCLLILFNFLCGNSAFAGNCDQRTLPYATAVTFPVYLKFYDSTQVDDNVKVDFKTGATFQAGDVKVTCGSGAEGNVATLPTVRGSSYLQSLSVGETTCAYGTIHWKDQTSPAVWIPHCLEFVTYNSSSAFHSTPSRANVIQWNSTNVPTEDTAGYPIATIKDGSGSGEINTALGKVVSVASVDAVNGNVTGTINGLTATALKDFFDTDSTATFGTAVAGSVVSEIATNCSGGGGSCTNGGWTTHTAGTVTKTTAKLASTDTYGQNAIAENTTFHIVDTSTHTGKGQSQRICLYTASTNTVTFCRPLQILPVGTVTYQLIPETDM